MKYLLTVVMLFSVAMGVSAQEVELGKDLNRDAIFFYGFDRATGFESYACVVDLGSFLYEMEAVERKDTSGNFIGYKCVDTGYYIESVPTFTVDIVLNPWPSDKEVPTTTFYIKR